jgi:hypothetical protein
MMRKTLCLFILSGVLIACDMDNSFRMDGILIYSGGGKKIMSLDLSRPELVPRVIYQSLDSISVINNLVKADGNSIIYEECQVDAGCAIKRLNLNTGDYEVMLYGQFPSYMPERNVLFFHEMLNSNRWIFSTMLNKLDEKEKVTTTPDKLVLRNGVSRSIAAPVISISSGEVLFMGPENKLLLYKIVEN